MVFRARIRSLHALSPTRLTLGMEFFMPNIFSLYFTVASVCLSSVRLSICLSLSYQQVAVFRARIRSLHALLLFTIFCFPLYLLVGCVAFRFIHHHHYPPAPAAPPPSFCLPSQLSPRRLILLMTEQFCVSALVFLY